MFTKQQLETMVNNVGVAIRTYHNAIANNLKEVNAPVKVQGDDSEIVGIRLSVEHDGTLIPYVFDLIKWDAEKNSIFVHATEYDEREVNEWMYLTDLGDAADYLLEAIQWEDDSNITINHIDFN